MQVLLEKRVIRRNARNTCFASKTSSRVMGNKRGVDMHEIHMTARNVREHPVQSTPSHAAVFRILRYPGGSDTQNPRLVSGAFVRGRGLVITRHDQQRIDTT